MNTSTRTVRRSLACVFAPLFVAAFGSSQTKPAARFETIACKAMEVAASARYGVRLVIFHYRDAQEREHLGQLLREYDGANIEFQTGNKPWSAATVLRLKTCFGRGLLVYGSSEAVVAKGGDFLLRFPSPAANRPSAELPPREVRDSGLK
jgi:hypothetical protein